MKLPKCRKLVNRSPSRRDAASLSSSVPVRSFRAWKPREGLRRSGVLPCDGGPSTCVLVSFLFFFLLPFASAGANATCWSVSLVQCQFFFSFFCSHIEEMYFVQLQQQQFLVYHVNRPQKYCVMFSCLLFYPTFFKCVSQNLGLHFFF